MLKFAQFVFAIPSLLIMPSILLAQDGNASGAVGGILCILVSIVAGVAGIVLHFAPILICMYRGHPDTAAIAIINVFLGWTIVGWWVAIIWAVKAFPRDKHGRAKHY